MRNNFKLLIKNINNSTPVTEFKNLFSLVFSQKMRFLQTIMILLIIYLFISKNIVFCSELDDGNFRSLDNFFIRGHETRIEIIRDLINTVDDPETLQYILLELQEIKDYHLPPVEDDPFSPNTEIINKNNFPLKSFFQTLLLFILLSIFGMFWFKFTFIIYPIIYYKQEIFILLSLIEKDPELYLELLADLYEQLVEEGIIYD